MDIETIPCCEELCVHGDAVARVRAQLPPDEQLYDLAELFRIFGDSTRVKILYALLESELCVCDIAKLMEITQSAVSHQLRVLKNSKLVRSRREGKTVYYSWPTTTCSTSWPRAWSMCWSRARRSDGQGVPGGHALQ